MNNQDSLSSRKLSLFALSKDDSLTIKGVAILLMIALHFLFPNSFVCAACIALFAFVSGYGLSTKLGRVEGSVWKAAWHSCSHFYWIYLFCFVLATVVFLVFPTPWVPLNRSVWVYAGAVTMVQPMYIDWWYATVFLCMTMGLYPLFLSLCRRFPSMNVSVALLMCGLFLVACGSHYVAFFVFSRFFPSCLGMMYSGDEYHLVSNVLTYSGIFCLGACYQRFCSTVSKSRAWWTALVCVCLLLIGYVIFSSFRERFAILPLLIGSVYLFRYLMFVRVPLMVLGRYSVWMWLNHRFLFGYWFAPFFHGLPPWLGYALLVVCSLLLAALMDVLFKACCRGVTRLRSFAG